jgi:hypothetical protein
MGRPALAWPYAGTALFRAGPFRAVMPDQRPRPGPKAFFSCRASTRHDSASAGPSTTSMEKSGSKSIQDKKNREMCHTNHQLHASITSHNCTHPYQIQIQHRIDPKNQVATTVDGSSWLQEGGHVFARAGVLNPDVLCPGAAAPERRSPDGRAAAEAGEGLATDAAPVGGAAPSRGEESRRH